MKNQMPIMAIVLLALTLPIFSMEEAASFGRSRADEIAEWNEARDQRLQELIATQRNRDREALTKRLKDEHEADFKRLSDEEKTLRRVNHNNRIIRLASIEMRRTGYSYETVFSLDHLSKFATAKKAKQNITETRDKVVSRIHNKPTLPSSLHLDQKMSLPERVDTKGMLEDRQEEINRGPSEYISELIASLPEEDRVSVSACEYISTKDIKDISSKTFACTILRASPDASPSTVCEAADSPGIPNDFKLSFEKFKLKS